MELSSICLTFLLISLINKIDLQLWKKFKGSDNPPPNLGSSRDYNVDMTPKV